MTAHAQRTLTKLHGLGRSAAFAVDFRTASFRADRRLARVARGSNPVLVGPWRSEIGFEVLYWIPLLNWWMEAYGIERDRLTVVSRGGPEAWYRDLAAGYVDIFDHFSAAELKADHLEQVERTGSQKQLRTTGFEQRILDRAADAAGLAAAAVLHPSVMYNLFRGYWAWRRPIASVTSRTSFRRLPRPSAARSAPPGLARLPRDYVAAKFYFSSCFPETDENRRFAAQLLDQLTRTHDVVLLSTGLDLDDHEDYLAGAASRIHSIDDLVTPRNNLDVQSRVIAGARALVTTYGGFAYLGPFLGVPSLSFYSLENFVPGHLSTMRLATAALRDSGLPVGFVPLHVRDVDLLETLIASPLEQTVS